MEILFSESTDRNPYSEINIVYLRLECIKIKL